MSRCKQILPTIQEETDLEITELQDAIDRIRFTELYKLIPRDYIDNLYMKSNATRRKRASTQISMA